MSETTDCWCGQPHPESSDDFAEAASTLGHLLLAKMRAPQIVEWLNRRLMGTRP